MTISDHSRKKPLSRYAYISENIYAFTVNKCKFVGLWFISTLTRSLIIYWLGMKCVSHFQCNIYTPHILNQWPLSISLFCLVNNRTVAIYEYITKHSSFYRHRHWEYLRIGQSKLCQYWALFSIFRPSVSKPSSHGNIWKRENGWYLLMICMNLFNLTFGSTEINTES